MINNTFQELGNKNITFLVDRFFYASTADSTGFVSFNYTGNSSKHAFEWVLQSDGNTTLFDMFLVAEHIGEVTSAPYPGYDINEDGIVDILDIVLVSNKLFWKIT